MSWHEKMSDDGITKTLELERFCRSRWRAFSQGGAGLIIDHDLASSRHTAKPGSQIHPITHDGVVGPVFRTETTGYDLTRGDAESDADPDARGRRHRVVMTQDEWQYLNEGVVPW